MKNRNPKFNKKNSKEKVTMGSPKRNFKAEYKGKNYNDTSWYTKNAQLVVDTANLPFNQPLNEPVAVVDGKYNTGQPMLMSFAHDWLVGNTDTLTVAARAIWADVRKVNSGSTNYEGSDILSIIIAAADVFINIKWLSSFFGIYSYFNARNKAMPRILFESANIDYDDFVRNLANYRARFNKLLLQARTITIPKKYPWIEAALALYCNLFKDEDTDTGREQLYFVNKAAFYHLVHNDEDASYEVSPFTWADYCKFKYGEDTEPAGSPAITASGRSTTPDQFEYSTIVDDAVITGSAAQGRMPIAFDFYLDILEAQITHIITDETANIIQGDIFKAFGETSAYTTGQIDASFEIKPQYSEEFGWYLHNALIYGTPIVEFGLVTDLGTMTGNHVCSVIAYKDPTSTIPWDGYYKKIKQVPGNNQFAITLEYQRMEDAVTAVGMKTFKPVMDTNKLNPSPEDVIWCTRAMNIWKKDSLQDSVISNGILLNMKIWYVRDTVGVRVTDSMNVVALDTKSVFAQDSDTPSFTETALISQFNWYPIIYKIYHNSTRDAAQLFGDLTNLTVIPRETLRRINDIVLLSLFDIPNR